MGSNKHIVGQSLTWLMTGIILLMITNSVVNTHSHIQSDGTIVTHAHPFQNSGNSEPSSGHKHSDMELQLIGNLSLLFFATLFILSLLFNPLYEYGFVALNSKLHSVHSSITKDRAPPIYSYPF